MENKIIPCSPAILGPIPDWVMKLLWFQDGPLKNFYDNERIDGYQIEPSLISLNLPIRVVDDYQSVCKPKYYPSYRDFSPEQRWIYLNWLRNPLNEIDVGYVFVFYYGLERHLLSDNYSAAFDAILKLRAAHPDIDNYAFEALLVSTVICGDKARFFNLIDGYVPTYWPTYLAAKQVFHVGLSSSELIRLAGSVKFTNRRYINSEFSLFTSTLDDLLIQKYESPFFPLDEIDISTCPKTTCCYLANYSIKPNIREYKLLNILGSESFRGKAVSLLVQTHEHVKAILKERRNNT